MSPSTDRYEYSTLEVDTEAQIQNEYGNNYGAQYPEVNQNATEHLNYPEVVSGDLHKTGSHLGSNVDSTLPEPVHIPETEKAIGVPAPRICGLKRKVFWGVLVAAIIVIIAIVVGVTAGVVTRKNSSSSDSGSSGSNNDGADSPSNATAVYAQTNLATANFTDEFGYENYLVAYQLNNKALYLSAWNSSRKSWVVSPIVDSTETNNLGLDDIRKGTALALDVFAYNDTTRDIHVYWQLPDSGGLATIKALTYTSQRGITTQAALPAANWVDSEAGNSYISTAGSSLISYGKQCDLCNQYTYLYWQQADGIRVATYENSTTGWESDNDVIQVDLPPPSTNSSLVQAHAAAATTDGHRSMNIFYRATTSALSQIVNGDGRYVGHALGRDVGPKTTIAAFSTGFNETSTGWSEPLGFQVLTMDPAANDGVQLTYYKGSSWTTVSKQVQDLSDCKARGTMTANHARRIYCLVDRTGGGVDIVEYAWKGDPDDTSTYSNYNKVGAVVTTV
ncbi:hypothetical protein GGR54DRAFT_590260 [Hypoxylon sp. NC1633]|nr:hypothetical protein GGR54DRAFT_590260 [Hypoxylon sp. NC1633]